MLKEYVEKIMRNGIKNFAVKKDKKNNEVQILIYWDEKEQVVSYKKLVLGEPSEPIKFLDILNVKWDMMNREAICGNFIQKTLLTFGKKYQCEPKHLFVLVHLNESIDEIEDVHLELYKGTTPLQQINLEEILA